MSLVRDNLAAFSFLPLGLLVQPVTGTLLAVVYLFLILVGQGAALFLALKTPSLRAADLPPLEQPVSLSVIIPAKDEAEDLGRVLDDLGHQDLGAEKGSRMEVIVVCAESKDGTEERARQHPLRPLVIPEPPLPPGWVGKNWACHTGYLRAQGDLLLFLDADVRLAPTAVRAAATELTRGGHGLVTFAARVVMKGFWENVVLPMYTQFVLTYFMPHRVNRPDSRRAMANGQFLMVSRGAYERAGGHTAVRGYVLEDVKLAERVKSAGGSLRVLWAPDLVTTRMYTNRHEMFEGLVKNVHGTEFRAWRQVSFFFGIFALFLSPFLILGLAFLYLSLVWVLVSLVAISVTLLKQAAFQHALRAPPAYALTYPLGAAFYLALLLRSLANGLFRKEVRWKGRSYSMKGEGA